MYKLAVINYAHKRMLEDPRRRCMPASYSGEEEDVKNAALKFIMRSLTVKKASQFKPSLPSDLIAAETCASDNHDTKKAPKKPQDENCVVHERITLPSKVSLQNDRSLDRRRRSIPTDSSESYLLTLNDEEHKEAADTHAVSIYFKSISTEEELTSKIQEKRKKKLLAKLEKKIDKARHRPKRNAASLLMSPKDP